MLEIMDCYGLKLLQTKKLIDFIINAAKVETGTNFWVALWYEKHLLNSFMFNIKLVLLYQVTLIDLVSLRQTSLF